MQSRFFISMILLCNSTVGYLHCGRLDFSSFDSRLSEYRASMVQMESQISWYESSDISESDLRRSIIKFSKIVPEIATDIFLGKKELACLNKTVQMQEEQGRGVNNFVWESLTNLNDKVYELKRIYEKLSTGIVALEQRKWEALWIASVNLHLAWHNESDDYDDWVDSDSDDI